MMPVLLGELGTHARGKTLIVAAQAVPGDVPASGVALAFGKEGQEHRDRLESWVDWAREPGRALVLLPPFQRGLCEVPIPWEARWSDALAGGESEIGRLLARERQFELWGELIPVERVAGQVVTGQWRRHPNAGVVLVTTLPLWSLAALDHRPALRTWLDAAVALSGTPRPAQELTVPTTFQPAPTDWTVLLHLCTGPYPNESAALEALAASRLLRIDASLAAVALGRIQSAGWALGGALTEAGRHALSTGPYSIHARELMRMSHG
jgi:hypothetical protein